MWHLAVLAERPWAGSLQPAKGHLCPGRWYSVQLQHLCGLFAQARWHVPPHTEVTEDCPEKFISLSAIGSPLSDSNNLKNDSSPPSFLPCPHIHIATLIVFRPKGLLLHSHMHAIHMYTQMHKDKFLQ